MYVYYDVYKISLVLLISNMSIRNEEGSFYAFRGLCASIQTYISVTDCSYTLVAI